MNKEVIFSKENTEISILRTEVPQSKPVYLLMIKWHKTGKRSKLGSMLLDEKEFKTVINEMNSFWLIQESKPER